MSKHRSKGNTWTDSVDSETVSFRQALAIAGRLADETDDTDELIARPEPDPWTHLEPLFPVTSFTPLSKCPHNGPIAEGSAFVCMVCHASGKDGYRALPRNIKPLPDDLEEKPEADTEADKPKPAEAAKSNKLRGGLG